MVRRMKENGLDRTIVGTVGMVSLKKRDRDINKATSAREEESIGWKRKEASLGGGDDGD